MLAPDALHRLWETPMGVHRFEQADAVNETLVRVLLSLRALDPANDPQAAFYASGDDLLQRVRLPEWERLIAFIVDGLRLASGQTQLTNCPARSVVPGEQPRPAP